MGRSRRGDVREIEGGRRSMDGTHALSVWVQQCGWGGSSLAMRTTLLMGRHQAAAHAAKIFPPHAYRLRKRHTLPHTAFSVKSLVCAPNAFREAVRGIQWGLGPRVVFDDNPGGGCIGV
jgi:hypothetical protein